jgi:hypothetical protein
MRMRSPSCRFALAARDAVRRTAVARTHADPPITHHDASAPEIRERFPKAALGRADFMEQPTAARHLRVARQDLEDRLRDG